MDPQEFAAALCPIQVTDGRDEEPVTSAAVEAWENGIGDPSATVLLAAADAAGVEVEFLFQRLPVMQRLLRLEEQLRCQSDQLRSLRRRLTTP
jgi:transcriptional regulator with XRE-family HTH domain